MQSLDHLSEYLTVHPDSHEALTMVETLIFETTKQSLLKLWSGFNRETSLYIAHPYDSSQYLTVHGALGISIADMTDAYALNTAVARMCTGPGSS